MVIRRDPSAKEDFRRVVLLDEIHQVMTLKYSFV
jgi:hypothetical protein